jgi:hypothetical protein
MKTKSLKIITFILIIMLIPLFIYNELKEAVKINTVYCESIIQVDIGIDTVRTYNKDNLVIVKGRSSVRENYNVKLSELIDSELLTKPKSVKINGHVFYSITIIYNKIKIEYFSIIDHIYVKNPSGKIIYGPSEWDKRDKISQETKNNIYTILNRYK